MIDTAGTSNVPQTVLKAVGFLFLRQQPNGISLQKSIQKKGKKNQLAFSLVQIIILQEHLCCSTQSVGISG
jgi:hypothetical protein